MSTVSYACLQLPGRVYVCLYVSLYLSVYLSVTARGVTWSWHVNSFVCVTAVNWSCVCVSVCVFVSLSVFVRDCTRCHVVVACQQFRMRVFSYLVVFMSVCMCLCISQCICP